jgi:hypothetical protein
MKVGAGRHNEPLLNRTQATARRLPAAYNCKVK